MHRHMRHRSAWYVWASLHHYAWRQGAEFRSAVGVFVWWSRRCNRETLPRCASKKGLGLLPIIVSHSKQVCQHVTCDINVANLVLTWSLGMSYKGLVCRTLRTLFFHFTWNFVGMQNYVCVSEQFVILLVREFKLICVNKSILTRYLSDCSHIVALVSIVQEHWRSNKCVGYPSLLTYYNDVNFTVHLALRDTTN
jgi:hypothetical protein